MLPGQPAAVERRVHGLACRAAGLGMRATARVCEVAPPTGLHWLVDAAEPLRAVTPSFLCAVHGRQGPRAEL